MPWARISGLLEHPTRVWWVTLLSIFLAEYAVMEVVLPWLLPQQTSWIWASSLDAIILTLLVAPVMWWTCVRPLQQLVRMRTRFVADLFATIEVERRRIAHELHDGVGQSLTLLVSGLRSLSANPDRHNLPQRLQELQGVAQVALKDIRQIALGLRPSLLDDLGLAPAVERVAAQVQENHHLQMTVDVTAVAGVRLPDAVETALFRIFQEAITNVVKHAAARAATVQVRLGSGAVFLSVCDDGRGFDTGQTGGWAPASGRWGLVGMRERVALLGGTLAVDSKPGGGTRVTATIPTVVAATAPPEPAVPAQ